MIEYHDKNEKLYNEDEILITLESFNREENTLLFDFIDEKHLLRFNDLIQDENLKNDKSNASMLFILNFKPDRKFKDGTYYNVNKDTIKSFEGKISLAEDSSIIKYIIDFQKKEITSFILNSRISKDYLEDVNESRTSNGNSIEVENEVCDSIKLIVRNVGQGSWNEIVINNNPTIVFDIGTHYLTKRKDVKKMMSDRDKDYQLSRPIVILSHWDVDHYHILLEAEDDTIRSIKYFIHRAKIPNKKSKDLIGRFNKLNPQALIAIPERSAAPKRSSEKIEYFMKIRSSIHLYNGSQNANRNKSGILITYKSTKLCVVFGADFHYSQINDHVLPDLKYKHLHYLIVPHHGGEAGRVIYKMKNVEFKDALISVGKNSYGHPFESVKDELKLLKFNPIDFRLRAANDHYELNLKTI